MLGRLIHKRELALSQRDATRRARTFDWGADFISDANGLSDIARTDPKRFFREYARHSFEHSEEFYRLDTTGFNYQLAGDTLTWMSQVQTGAPENNVVHARLFPADATHPKGRERKSVDGRKRAVVVLPQWNADEASHVGLCRLLNRFGITALRLTLPYHEARRPPGFTRAEYLVDANIGRTIQSAQQAVLDTRAAVNWLAEHGGFDSIGITGTSVGSCVAFLAFAHDERIKVGVYNHVSGYFADVVWRGISTSHVRDGFADHITLDDLREFWLMLSPYPFAEKLQRMTPRPMRFIAARYDLSFPPDLSRDVIAEVRRRKLPLDVAWIPCGHYTSGETPWKYLYGWKIVSFFRRHL